MDLRDELHRARLMAITPVDEVGHGTALGAKLVAQGINTVADLVASDAKGYAPNTAWWSSGSYGSCVACLGAELTVEPAAKLRILSSRSFGERVTDRGEMAQALSGFMARAARSCGPRGCVASGCTCSCEPAPLTNERLTTVSRLASGWSAPAMIPGCCCSK